MGGVLGSDGLWRLPVAEQTYLSSVRYFDFYIYFLKAVGLLGHRWGLTSSLRPETLYTHVNFTVNRRTLKMWVKSLEPLRTLQSPQLPLTPSRALNWTFHTNRQSEIPLSPSKVFDKF